MLEKSKDKEKDDTTPENVCCTRACVNPSGGLISPSESLTN